MSHSTNSSSGAAGTSGTSDKPETHRAGAFDIRIFIASLIGIYGVVLVVVGLFDTSDKELVKSGHVNVNLWAGIPMIVISLLFVAWARWRPVVVPDDPEADEAMAERPPGH